MSTPDTIPTDIRIFVHSCIDSVEQLEVLALLHDQPEKEWTAKSISQELRSTEGSVEKRLRDLARTKVLEPLPPSGTFRFSPCSPEVKNTIEEVVKYYRVHPFRVMDLLFSKPMNAMQSFADAFRFKKDDS